MTKGCEHGTFGTNCSMHCNGHCLNNVPCNSTNGHCDSGCASGYLEAFCNKSKFFRKLQETAYDTYNVRYVECYQLNFMQNRYNAIYINQ